MSFPSLQEGFLKFSYHTIGKLEKSTIFAKLVELNVLMPRLKFGDIFGSEDIFKFYY